MLSYVVEKRVHLQCLLTRTFEESDHLDIYSGVHSMQSLFFSLALLKRGKIKTANVQMLFIANST
jgi:hypothetical protein